MSMRDWFCIALRHNHTSPISCVMLAHAVVASLWHAPQRHKFRLGEHSC